MNWKLVLVASIVATVVLTSSMAVMATTSVPTGSPYKPHDPILIVGDKGFTSANGVTSGSGTPADPYLIEGWEIGPRVITAILIKNTSAHFIIRDLNILAPSSAKVPGIWLMNSTYAWISNVTIDGRSHGVKADLPKGAEPVRDLYITNSRITNCQFGIFVNDTANVVIQNNSISTSINGGISISRSPSTHISDNIIVDSARHGKDSVASLHIEKSNQTWILRNRIVKSNTNGIEVSRSTDLMVASNKLEGILQSWLELTNSSGAEVMNNHARNSGNSTDPMASGLTMYNDTDCRVESNNMVDSSVFLDRVTWSHFVSNELTNGTGISMTHSSNSTLSGNRLIGIQAPTKVLDWHALSIQLSANMTVEDNVVQAREGGNGGVVSLVSINFSTLGHNVLLSGNSSVTDHFSGRGTKFDNNMMDKVQLEISGNNLTIDGNNLTGANITTKTKDCTITNNSFWDESHLTELNPTTFTSVFNNNFMTGAAVKSLRASGNAWDDGYPTGGNFWADNASTDDFGGAGQNVSGSDGISDTNLTLPGGAVDRYPLMAKVQPTDTLAPVSSLTISGFRGTNGWFLSQVMVDISAHDESSGVAAIHWRLDDGTLSTFTSVIFVQGDGTHVLEYYSVDSKGNTEPTHEVTIGIDSTYPMVMITAPADGTWLHRPTMIVRWTSSDSTSGLAYFALKAESWTNSKIETGSYLLMTSVAPDHYAMHVTATDDAGNQADASVQFVITYESSLVSWHGPWGALFNIALLLDVIAIGVLVFSWSKFRASKITVKAEN